MLVLNHSHKFSITMTTGSHSIMDVSSIFRANVLLESIQNFIFDATDNFNTWSLFKDPSKSTSSFSKNTESLDTLIQNLILELSWIRVSDIVWKLSTLRFNNVGFSWLNIVHLRIRTSDHRVLNFLLVNGSWILMINESFSWRPMLSLDCWLVKSIEHCVSVDCANNFSGTCSDINELIHKFFKFILNCLGLLIDVWIFDWTYISNHSRNLSSFNNNSFLDFFWRLIHSASIFISSCIQEIHCSLLDLSSPFHIIDCFFNVEFSCDSFVGFWFKSICLGISKNTSVSCLFSTGSENFLLWNWLSWRLVVISISLWW